MEVKKTIFDFLEQVGVVFGVVILILNILCLLVGEAAKGVSAIFANGSRGIPVPIVFQFLGASVLMVGIRFVFQSDFMIKKMSGWLRTLCMLSLIFVVMIAFITLFHWFPADQGMPWLLFSVCYLTSFSASVAITALKERQENQKLEEALQRLKKREDDKREV